NIPQHPAVSSLEVYSTSARWRHLAGTLIAYGQTSNKPKPKLTVDHLAKFSRISNWQLFRVDQVFHPYYKYLANCIFRILHRPIKKIT
ncbi:hypothetical protein, partial [Chitinimonas sp. BJB300]|uniref:hypothetical protein n=1 Tax=Chitinimonas sp. BJB300 TaxID=1559339 RepID=UPI001E4FF226